MPVSLLIFAVLIIIMVEVTFRATRKNQEIGIGNMKKEYE